MVQAYDYYGTATSKGETEPPLQGRLIGISSIQLCCGSTDQVAPAVVDRHDETGGTHLVTNEDLYSAASGYFFMATDSRGGGTRAKAHPDPQVLTIPPAGTNSGAFSIRVMIEAPKTLASLS